MQNNPIQVIGLGPAPDRLAPQELEIVRGAEVLAGGEELLEAFQDSEAEFLPLRTPLAEWIGEIVSRREQGRRIAVLADGDPLFYGIGSRLCHELGPETVRVHPGVSVLQAAAARLCLPWSDILTVSLHGRGDMLVLRRALARSERVGVYTDPENTPDLIAAFLKRIGAEDFRVHVLENLFGEQERISCLSPDQAAKESFAEPNFVLLERSLPPRIALTPGMPEESLERERGLISKPEVRLAALGRLQPECGHTLWDIGAGSGSLSLEASLLIREGRILAVERDKSRAAQIETNIVGTGAFGVEVILDTAPDCFQRLPDPDLIFLGGGAGQGHCLLDEAWSRLRPGGRLVASLVLLGSLQAVLDWAWAKGLQPELTQIQVSRSAPLQGDLRLAARNPVFLLALHKPPQSETP
ncbi:MAG: precorrin-6y C5,15-methyltransferase (decarboxylating) subunit CbiE [Desulfohalobiaceae bacterium]|nr:precorrin-6y C5,15-methyltransferase (decarboxylating) subunit CbiE [Desulfohalobiaceae bacterium]